MKVPSTAPYVPFAAPCLDERDAAAVAEVVRRGWVSTGAEAAAFEREMAALTGRRFAVATNSCTAALHLTFLGSGIGPGDEVLVPTMTFTATAAAAVHAGARPVLVDVDPNTMNISPEAVERALGPRTRAVVAVHVGGRMADMEGLAEVVAGRDVALVEDAAHALPAYRNGRVAGSCGHSAAFSFFATKPITTGEGGMLVTDEPALHDAARVWGRHGISPGAEGSPPGSAGYEVHHPGYKYNLSDLQAALGRSQLARSDELWSARRTVAAAYGAALHGSEYVELPRVDDADDRSSWYLYVVRLRLDRLRIDRDRFCLELERRGVGTSVHFRPLHTYEYYRANVVRPGHDLSVADSLYPRILSLPVHANMTEADARRVAEVVEETAGDFAR